MESFSDGVFGFAATLLVADLALGHGPSALRQVLNAWPAFVAYIISFLTIGAAWLAHTGLTNRLAQVDPVFLRLNLLLLLPVAFLPFPTRLVAEAVNNSSGEKVFVTMYGLTLLVIRVLGSALDGYARREHLYSPHEDDEDSPHEDGEELHSDRRKLLPVVIGYATAILIGLPLPELAVALYFGIAVYAIVPFRQVARLLFPRS